MLEEAVILGGQHRAQQRDRNVPHPHGPVLLARTIVDAGEDFGIEGNAAEGATVGDHADDPVLADLQAEPLRLAPSARRWN